MNSLPWNPIARILSAWLTMFVFVSAGAEFRLDDVRRVNTQAEIQISKEPGFYYILWRGDEPTDIHLATDLSLGTSLANALTDTNRTNHAQFYRVEKLPITSLRDTDGDGLSDMWELLHRPSGAALNDRDAEEDLDANGVADKTDALRESLREGGLRGRPVIAAGRYHSLAIRQDGTLWGWGDNLYGQLGFIGFTEVNSPTQIGTETNWSAVSIGGLTSYGLKSDGTLWVWSQNSSTETLLAPTQIGSNANWIGLPKGRPTDNPTALQADGTRWQFVGSFTNAQQLGSDDWAAVAGGGFPFGNWAIKSGGTLWKGPSMVNTNPVWTSISLGIFHALALQKDGTLWAWAMGGNPPVEGQLGLGNASPSEPTQVGMDTWAAVSAGWYHSVGIKGDGSLWWWGVNHGFAPNEAGLLRTNLPVRVGINTDWLAVAADSTHTLALRTDGTIWTFGINEFGKLGNGTVALVKEPAQIGTTHDWSEVAVGTLFSFALKSNGTMWAWGANKYGVLGVGDFTSSSSPRQIPGSNWLSVSGGNDHTAALQQDGSLWVWGKHIYGTGNNDVLTNLPIRLGMDSDWNRISAGWQHTLGMKTNRTLWSWGRNARGELGNGSIIGTVNSPAQISGPGAWTNFSAGYYSSLGVAGSRLYTWGSRVGPSSISPSPEEVDYTFNWKAVANAKGTGPTLNTHALALKQNGTLWSWGYNIHGQLGDGTNTTTIQPGQVGTSTNWLSIAAGSTFSSALQRDGSLWLWGENAFGQLGSGTRLNTNRVSQTGSETNWTSVAAGNQHTLALKADGSLWAWGDNSYGQCAQPALFEPAPVAGTNWGKPR